MRISISPALEQPGPTSARRGRGKRRTCPRGHSRFPHTPEREMGPEKSLFQNTPFPPRLQHLRLLWRAHPPLRAETGTPSPTSRSLRKREQPAPLGGYHLASPRLVLPSPGAGCFPRGAGVPGSRGQHEPTPPGRNPRPPRRPGRERPAPAPGRRPADREGGGGRTRGIFLPSPPPAPASARASARRQRWAETPVHTRGAGGPRRPLPPGPRPPNLSSPHGLAGPAGGRAAARGEPGAPPARRTAAPRPARLRQLRAHLPRPPAAAAPGAAATPPTRPHPGVRSCRAHAPRARRAHAPCAPPPIPGGPARGRRRGCAAQRGTGTGTGTGRTVPPAAGC